jgi:hypothetical protein
VGKYRDLIMAGSFVMEDGARCVNSELINEVAKLWAADVANWDTKNGTNTVLGVNPL